MKIFVVEVTESLRGNMGNNANKNNPRQIKDTTKNKNLKLNIYCSPCFHVNYF